MSNILGNLIDNANGSKPRGRRTIYWSDNPTGENISVIKIINQYSRDFSENLKTTKKKQEFHGIGIRSVKSIVTKYEGEFSIDKKGTEVVVKILIPN